MHNFKSENYKKPDELQLHQNRSLSRLETKQFWNQNCNK